MTTFLRHLNTVLLILLTGVIGFTLWVASLMKFGPFEPDLKLPLYWALGLAIALLVLRVGKVLAGLSAKTPVAPPAPVSIVVDEVEQRVNAADDRMVEVVVWQTAAERQGTRFFRMDSAYKLNALREIALEVTSDQTDADLIAHKALYVGKGLLYPRRKTL